MFFNFGPKVPEVSPEDVKKAIDNKEHVIILDVRTPGEVSRGKLHGSINLPVDDLEGKIQTVIPDKNQKVYVYCLSGSRSTVAVQTMVQKGYSNVHNMTNGIMGWRVKQFPLES